MEGLEVDVKVLRLEPRVGPLSDPLEIALTYSLSGPVKDPSWHMSFSLDVQGTRHDIALKSWAGCAEEELSAGEHSFEGVLEETTQQLGGLQQELQSLDGSMGLLVLELRSGGAEVAAIQVPTFLSTEGAVPHRNILNPFAG